MIRLDRVTFGYGLQKAVLRDVSLEIPEGGRLCLMGPSGKGKSTVLRRVTLPGIRPYVTAAVTTGVGFAWKSGIAAEVICRTQGSLGDLLWSGKASVSYDEVFALTVVIVVCSGLLQRAATGLRRKEERHDPS